MLFCTRILLETKNSHQNSHRLGNLTGNHLNTCPDALRARKADQLKQSATDKLQNRNMESITAPQNRVMYTRTYTHAGAHAHTERVAMWSAKWLRMLKRGFM